MAAHIDVHPTLVELAGVKLDAKVVGELDGLSLVPLLLDQKERPNYDNRILMTNRGRWTSSADRHAYTSISVRWRKYSLVHITWDCGNSDCRSCAKMKGRTKWAYSKDIAKHLKKTNGWELFDLASDAGQNTNIAGRHPEVVAKLKTAYDQWWKSVRPMMVNEPQKNP